MIFLLTWSAFIKRLKSAYAVTFFRICSIRCVVRLGTEIEVGLQPSNIKQLKQLLEGKQALKWDFYTQVWCTVTQLPIYRRFSIRIRNDGINKKLSELRSLRDTQYLKTLLYNIMIPWYYYPRTNFIQVAQCSLSIYSVRIILMHHMAFHKLKSFGIPKVVLCSY